MRDTLEVRAFGLVSNGYLGRNCYGETVEVAIVIVHEQRLTFHEGKW